MNFLRKIRWSYAVASLLMIVFGTVFIVAASFIKSALCLISGIVLTVYGIVRVVRHFIAKDPFVDSLLVGVLLAMFGFILITRADQVIDMVFIFIGILLLLDGVCKLKNAFESKGAGQRDWVGVLIWAMVVMGAGILIIIDPFDGTLPLIVLGVALILDGGQNLYGVIRSAIYRKAAYETVLQAEVLSVEDGADR